MGSKNKSKGNKNTKQTNNSGDPTPPPPPQVSKHHGARKKGAVVTTDPRFAAVQSDPRFQKVPQREKKVAIDSRFERVFTDKRFAPSSAPVDKRGKRRKEKSSRDSINDFYRIEKENIGKTAKAKKRDSEEDSEAEEESETEKLPKTSRPEEEEASGSESGSESDEEESGDSDEEASTEEEEDDAVLEDDETNLLEEDIQTIEKETHRLAVVNMDWRHIKAVDLYMMLSSFLPKDGQIQSVAVYPSEFGLQRMKEEEVHGPVGLFDDENETKDEDGEDDAEEEGSGDDDSDDEDNYEDDSDEQYEDSKNGEDEEGSDEDDNEEYDDENDDADDTTHHDDEEIDGEKLRAYEMSKLRYYFAVVECDSSATADHLYKACDGSEFERSSNVLDLRFIPDSMEFKHPPRDVATEAPGKYEGADFQTRALQLSKIHLTWDEDEPERVKTLRQNFTADQLAELELNEFLASDESDDDEEEDDTEDQNVRKQKKRDKYRALIESADGGDEDDDNEDVNGGQDMEVTFNTGLEDLSKRILEKKDNKSESVWEAYLKKKREKKRARKDKFNHDSEDDDSSDPDVQAAKQDDDFFLEEPPVKKSKKETRGRTDKQEQHQETKKEVEASTAELELLVSDDEENAPKGYNLKRKKPKGKKGQEAYEDKIPDSDFNDQRFSALFTSSKFALDPTDPQFKRSAVYARQVAQRRQKSDKEEPVRTEPVDVPTKEDHTKSESTSKKEKQELSSLVKSVKLKNLDRQSSTNTVKSSTQSVKKTKVRK